MQIKYSVYNYDGLLLRLGNILLIQTWLLILIKNKEFSLFKPHNSSISFVFF